MKYARLGCVAVFSMSVAAQVTHGQATAIPWSTTDSGGGRVVHASGLALEGTIGQHDAAVPVTSGMLRLASGFWPGAFFTSTPMCIADTDNGNGTGTPDGGVTIEDLLYYLVLFEAGDLAADVDDGSSTGTPDGGVTIDDLLYYLARFEAGC